MRNRPLNKFISAILLIMLAIIGIAVAVYSHFYAKDTIDIKKRIGERKSNLQLIVHLEKAYYDEHKQYVPCKPSPTNGGTDSYPDEWEDAGGFTQIGFSPEGNVVYKYSVVVDGAGSFTVIATGDVDKNGKWVTFSMKSTESIIRQVSENEI